MSDKKSKPVAAIWADPEHGVDLDSKQMSRLDAHNLRRLLADLRFITGAARTYLSLSLADAAVTGRRQLTRRGMPARKAQL